MIMALTITKKTLGMVFCWLSANKWPRRLRAIVIVVFSDQEKNPFPMTSGISARKNSRLSPIIRGKSAGAVPTRAHPNLTLDYHMFCE